MKKIVLLEPDKFYSGPVFPPMALLYVAASINPRPDLEWQIVDYNVGGRVDPFLADPDVIAFGITSVTGDQLAAAMRVANKIKAARPDTPIIWGGIHAASRPDECLREKFVDIVVPGESDPVINPLIDCLLQNNPLDDVPGILFKRNGEPVRTATPPPADLARLRPLPFQRIPLEKYERSLLYLNTSRGCPHRCDFCCSTVDTKKWRAMPPELFVEHLAQYLDVVRPKRVFFSDYNFFLDMKRALDICALMISRDVKIPWTAHLVAADVKKLNESALLLLRGSGCASVVTGQDGSERLMPIVGKSSTHQEVGAAQQALENIGITMTINYILALPEETEADLGSIVRDIKKREERSGDLNVYIFNAWPGTPIVDKLDPSTFQIPTDMAGWADLMLSNADPLRFHSWRHRGRVQTMYYVICLLNDRHIQWFTGRAGTLFSLARRVLGATARWRWEREFFYLGVETRLLHRLTKYQRNRERQRCLARI